MYKRKFEPFICLIFIFSLLVTLCSAPIPSYEPEPLIREDVAFSSLDFYLPEPDELKTLIHTFVDDMKASKSAEEQIELIVGYDREIRWYTDMGSIARIRFYQNTSDEKAKADYEDFAQLFAGISQDEHEADKAVVESKYIKGLETYFGKDIIDQYRDSVREYNPTSAELLVELIDLQNQYVQLTSKYLEPTIKFINDADALLSEIIPLRDKIAKAAGYDSYIEYSFSSWSIELSDVKTFIENVKQTVLPVYQKLVDNSGGNWQERCPAAQWIMPVYSGDEDEFYALSTQMLRSTLDETNPLIDYIERNEMLDVTSRYGKMQGAYTFPLYGAQIPFVYASYPDPNTMIHEFGHALEVYTWSKIELRQRLSVTPETMEVASTCMEVLATAQYELLYGDTAEYARMAQTHTLVFDILEKAMLCEFELALYENSDMTKGERDALFNGLVGEYRMYPYSWTTIRHFFDMSLYTISYSIDSVVALDLLNILQDDPAHAKEVYMAYLRDSMNRDFTARLTSAGFRNPLERQTLEDLAQSLDTLFNSDEYMNPERLKMAG